MIADNSKARAVKQEDQIWMNEIWFPKAIAAGFKTSAVVVAQDVFRNLAVKKIINELDSRQFTVQFFSTYHEAESWIQTLQA